MSPCGALEGKDLVLEDDGSFEIILSKEKRGKNWLKIEEETGMAMVRQTFLNRFEEIPAEINIENLDGRKFPESLTPKMVDEGLKMASMFVAGATLLFVRWANGFKKHVNELLHKKAFQPWRCWQGMALKESISFLDRSDMVN